MENRKRQTEIDQRTSNREKFSGDRFSFSVCVACGAEAQRANARFCLICGKLLSETYQPLDAFRAAHHLQGKDLESRTIHREETENLFEQNKNSVANMAWACLVYSFVPYLGILFVPLTITIGSFGLYVSHREPNLGGRRISLISISLSFIVLLIQLFLWWLLYIVPELGK